MHGRKKGLEAASNDVAVPEGQMSQNKYWGWAREYRGMSRTNHPENGSRNVCDGHGNTDAPAPSNGTTRSSR